MGKTAKEVLRLRSRAKPTGDEAEGEQTASQQTITSFFSKGNLSSSTNKLFSTYGNGKKSADKKPLKLTTKKKKKVQDVKHRPGVGSRSMDTDATNSDKKTKNAPHIHKQETKSEESPSLLSSREKGSAKLSNVNGASKQRNVSRALASYPDFKSPVNPKPLTEMTRGDDFDDDVIPPTPSPTASCRSFIKSKSLSSPEEDIPMGAKDRDYTQLKSTGNEKVDGMVVPKKPLSPKNRDKCIISPGCQRIATLRRKPESVCSVSEPSCDLSKFNPNLFSSCDVNNKDSETAERLKKFETVKETIKTNEFKEAMQKNTRKTYKLSKRGSKSSASVAPLHSNPQKKEMSDVAIAACVTVHEGMLDEVATPMLAPRKIVMAKSKAKSLKRRASKGSSPVNKKHHSDIAFPNSKEKAKCNLFNKMDARTSFENSALVSNENFNIADVAIVQIYGRNILSEEEHLLRRLRDGTTVDSSKEFNPMKVGKAKSMDEDETIDHCSDCSSDVHLGGNTHDGSRGMLNASNGARAIEREQETQIKETEMNELTENASRSLIFREEFCKTLKKQGHQFSVGIDKPNSEDKTNSSTLMRTPSKAFTSEYDRHRVTDIGMMTPTKGLLDTSRDSLVDVDLNGLLEGVEWSPMAKTSPWRQMKLSSSREPPRAGANRFDSTANDTLPYSPHTTPYRRYLVLEVYRREVSGDGDIARYGRAISEKVLRVFDEGGAQERYCYLRQDWENTEVEPGDIVHVTGEFNATTGVCILDNTADQYIIIHPDTLVSGTTVAGATRCLRRSILNERFRTEDANEAMLMGTLLHDLFDRAMSSKEFSKEALLETAKKLLQQQSYLNGFYGLGMTETAALEKMTEHLPAFSDWTRRFILPFPDPDLSVMDYKSASAPISSDQPSVCITELRDIEENVWSPRFGLKGKVDATVEVKIDRRARMRRHRPDKDKQVETAVVPLELKTGKLFNKLGSVEHRAQVILYTLLLCDRYRHAVDTGLLYYMKSGHTVGVPALVHEKRALVMRRNDVARYLALNRTSGGRHMPGMLQDPHTCSRCSQAQNCTIFHKAIENGNHMTSGMGEQFDDLTKHLTPGYTQFFSDWFKLVCLEGKATQHAGKSSQHSIWTMKAWDREQLGQCFSGMVLKSSVLPAGDDVKHVHKFERSVDHPAQTPLMDVPITAGDRVVVSEDGTNVIAIATGYVRDVQDDEVEVTLDSNLAQCRKYSPDEAPVYRLDKDEGYSSLTTLWSNVAKLFNKDSERDSQLRRVIIDLEPPVFSRNRQALLNFSSQSSVGFTQSPATVDSSHRFQEVSAPRYRDTAVEAIVQELNSDQKRAILKALNAEDYALILGMPGTGKTTTIACLVRVLVASGKSVLLTSYTHTAVDNILLKLREAQLDFLRLGQVHKILPEIQPYSAQIAGAHIKTVNELRQFYDSKAVVATTCLGVNHALFTQRSFDYCIVDEASQITQPVCLGPLRHASAFVLVGDHYQLPPLVQSLEAREGGMDVSLFKRLSECHPQAVVSLEHQYRMHENIMTLSNTLIYEGRLKCGTQQVATALLDIPLWDDLVRSLTADMNGTSDNWLIQALDPRSPVVFLNTDTVPAQEVRAGHLVSNETEAILVQQLTCALWRGGVKASCIGIISPYRHQLKLIRLLLNDISRESREELEINTVDKYQGRDKPCILVSLVRSNDSANVGDLLKDWRRVNVAVTRAKRKLVLIGSFSTLKASLLLHELLDLLEEKKWIRKLPKDAHKMYPSLTEVSSQNL